MKLILPTLKTLRNWTLLVGISLTLSSVIMVYKTLNIGDDADGQSHYNSETNIAPGIYIVSQTKTDLKGEIKYMTEIQFRNPANIFGEITPFVSYNLSDNGYKYIPYIFSIFYSVIMLLIFLIFYNLYLFLRHLKEDQPFERRNLNYLGKSGIFLIYLSGFYMFGNMAVNLILELIFDISIQQYYLNFESFMLIFFFGFGGTLIKLLIKIAMKGEEIQMEQNLTV